MGAVAGRGSFGSRHVVAGSDSHGVASAARAEVRSDSAEAVRQVRTGAVPQVYVMRHCWRLARIDLLPEQVR